MTSIIGMDKIGDVDMKITGHYQGDGIYIIIKNNYCIAVIQNSSIYIGSRLPSYDEINKLINKCYGSSLTYTR